MMLEVSAGSPDRTYDQVARALAKAGGVWREMYRGSAGYGARAFTPKEWRLAPGRVASLVTHAGGSARGLHFVITRAAKVERVEDRFGRLCGNPMACQWALADQTPLNRRIVAHGVGAYRTADQAPDWLREFNRRFPNY